MKGQLTGMRGVYLVAAELARLGFIASPTSRSAAGADILVTDQNCTQSFSVQVKTNSGHGTPGTFWLLGKHIPVSRTHVYILVNLQSKREGEKTVQDTPEYFVVESATIKDKTVYEPSKNGEWYSVARKDVFDCLNKWEIFGDPHGEVKIEGRSVCEEAGAEAGES